MAPSAPLSLPGRALTSLDAHSRIRFRLLASRANDAAALPWPSDSIEPCLVAAAPAALTAGSCAICIPVTSRVSNS